MTYTDKDSLVSVDSYEYKDDEMGSWIEKKKFANDIFVKLTARVNTCK